MEHFSTLLVPKMKFTFHSSFIHIDKGLDEFRMTLAGPKNFLFT
jgi:hypothetical protein